MKRIGLAAITVLALLASRSASARDGMEPDPAALINVNDRYTVESIDFSSGQPPRVSESILSTLKRLIGDKLNLEALNRLCAQIGGEVHANQVTFRLARGSQPDQIKVLLDVEPPKVRFDADVPKFLYQSRQGWSGIGEARMSFGFHTLSLAILSDGDDSVERFSGVRASYQRQGLGSDRVQVSFTFDDLQHHYNDATGSAALLENNRLDNNGSVLYRGRMDFQPAVTVLLAQPLTLTLGYGLEDLRPQNPANGNELVSAAVTNLRYRRQWGTETARHLLDVSYAFRFASRSLGSGYSFVRHEVAGRYQWKRDRQSLEARVLTGSISGNAPVIDRFVLGTSTTLRGWNKYDIDPLGGNRVAHGSVTYGYRRFRFFYDAGSIWTAGQTPEFRESAGAGFEKDRFLFAVAFPFRAGRIDPVLIAGMNF